MQLDISSFLRDLHYRKQPYTQTKTRAVEVSTRATLKNGPGRAIFGPPPRAILTTGLVIMAPRQVLFFGTLTGAKILAPAGALLGTVE